MRRLCLLIEELPVMDAPVVLTFSETRIIVQHCNCVVKAYRMLMDPSYFLFAWLLHMSLNSHEAWATSGSTGILP